MGKCDLLLLPGPLEANADSQGLREVLLPSDKGTMRCDRDSTVPLVSGGVCGPGRREALRQPQHSFQDWGATRLPSTQALGGSLTP